MQTTVRAFNVEIDEVRQISNKIKYRINLCLVVYSLLGLLYLTQVICSSLEMVIMARLEQSKDGNTNNELQVAG